MVIKEISNASKSNIRTKAKAILTRLALIGEDNLNVAQLRGLEEVREYFEANREYFIQKFNGVIKSANNKVGYMNDISSFSFGKSMAFLEDVLDLPEVEWTRIDRLYNLNYLNTEEQIYTRLGDNIDAYKVLDDNDDANFIFRTRRDKKVRDKHRLFDGIIRPKSDPWWRANWVLDEPGCRCALKTTNAPQNDFSTGPLNGWKSGLWGFIPANVDYLIPSDHTYHIKANENMFLYGEWIKNWNADAEIK